MLVLKFGGTSLGSPEKMKNVCSLINQQEEGKKIIVLSAVSGTTNQLVRIYEAYKKLQFHCAQTLLTEMREYYEKFIDELYEGFSYKRTALGELKKHMDELCVDNNSIVNSQMKNKILAQGELLSSCLFQLYLEEQRISSILLPALEIIRLSKDHTPDEKFIKEKLNHFIGSYTEKSIFITQGFICRNIKTDIDNLNRGGSDYTASLIGGLLKAREIQIWTDIDGIHNNDPRYIKHTTPIRTLSFNEAAELSYFGAKILHPQCIIPAKVNEVPVRLLQTSKPNLPGTIISGRSNSAGKIVAVAAKDNITFIRIKSSNMLLAHGFLHKIFEIFARFKTSIDMIATSEVAISLTIDNNRYLNSIQDELLKYGVIDIRKSNSIICVVGDFASETHYGHATTISNAVQHLPIQMISYGGSDHNMSLLLETKYKKNALESLHTKLF